MLACCALGFVPSEASKTTNVLKIRIIIEEKAGMHISLPGLEEDMISL